MNNKGKIFAVKRLNIVSGSDSKDSILRLHQEILLMKDYKHVNIVCYIGAKVDVDMGLLYIFQELVPGGSIAQLLKKFGPFEPSIVRQYTRQILFGLHFLHQNGIIHRDIKGGNVLVDSNTGVVKLADFGAVLNRPKNLCTIPLVRG
jgi:serine/threonine protein kinase